MHASLKRLLTFCIFSALLAGCSSGSDSRSLGDPSKPLTPSGDETDRIRAAGDVVLDANGKPALMSYRQALAYCHKQGSRLPTIREYVLMAVANGAAGARETEFPEASILDPRVAGEMEKNRADGFFPLFRRNKRGQKAVAFYFNQTGETAANPAHAYWSSPVPCGPRGDGAYIFSSSGFVCKDFRDVGLYEVRCTVNDDVSSQPLQ